MIRTRNSQLTSCSAHGLHDVLFGWNGFKRVADNGVFKAKTWLCEEHTPQGLAEADMLGRRVAKFVGGQILFGELGAGALRGEPALLQDHGD